MTTSIRVCHRYSIYFVNILFNNIQEKAKLMILNHQWFTNYACIIEIDRNELAKCLWYFQINQINNRK